MGLLLSSLILLALHKQKGGVAGDQENKCQVLSVCYQLFQAQSCTGAQCVRVKVSVVILFDSMQPPPNTCYSTFASRDKIWLNLTNICCFGLRHRDMYSESQSHFKVADQSNELFLSAKRANKLRFPMFPSQTGSVRSCKKWNRKITCSQRPTELQGILRSCL